MNIAKEGVALVGVLAFFVMLLCVFASVVGVGLSVMGLTIAAAFFNTCLGVGIISIATLVLAMIVDSLLKGIDGE